VLTSRAAVEFCYSVTEIADASGLLCLQQITVTRTIGLDTAIWRASVT